jgi:hypothetical protein
LGAALSVGFGGGFGHAQCGGLAVLAGGLDGAG